MMLNPGLPREDHSKQLNALLMTSRAMLYAALLVFALVFMLL